MLPVPTLPVYTQPYIPQVNYTVPSYPVPVQQLASTMPQFRQSVYNRSEVIGQETFDPDPITSSYDIQPPAQRVTAIGPYGPGGQNTSLTGVYKPPAMRTHVITDIHEHPVTTTQSPMSSYVSQAYPPMTSYTPPVAAYTPPVAAYTPPVAAYTPPVAAYTPPVAPYTPPVAAYTPPVAPYTPPVAPYTPPVAQQSYGPYTPYIPNTSVYGPYTPTSTYASNTSYMQPYQRTVTNRSQLIGQATFDPDPITSTYETQPSAQRVTAIGPYGQGGQQTSITGIYKPGSIRTYVTSDIHEHPVNVV